MKENSTKSGIFRPVAHTNEKSTLDPDIPKYWVLQEKLEKRTYPGYNNYEDCPNSWINTFSFTFESLELSAFENQLEIIYTDPKVFC